MASNKLQQYEQVTQGQVRQVIQSGTRTLSELDLRCAMLEKKIEEGRILNYLLTNPREFKVLSYQELKTEWEERISKVFPSFNLIYLHLDGQEIARDMGITGSLQFLSKALNCVRSSEFVAKTQDGTAVIIVAIGRVSEMIKDRVVSRLNVEGINVLAASGQCMSEDLGLCLKPLIEEIEERLSGKVDRFAAPVAKLGRGAVFNGKSVE